MQLQHLKLLFLKQLLQHLNESQKIKIGSRIIFNTTLESIPAIDIIGLPIALANCSNTKNNMTAGELKNITFKKNS